MCRFIVNKLSSTGYTIKNQAAFIALSAEGGACSARQLINYKVKGGAVESLTTSSGVYSLIISRSLPLRI